MNLGQLAQAFNQMAERLEHTEQMRLQLLADVSHELRTPLTAIKGSMEALIDGVLPAEAETFTRVEQEADRLQRLVNDLQELSRVESGAYELHLSSLFPWRNWCKLPCSACSRPSRTRIFSPW